MNRSGHYSTTSWISNPLDWFINGVGLRRMFYIWVCDIEKVLGSRTDQHWFIFQNSHADSETIIRYEVSPCQVLVKWSKSESDHHHLIIIIWSWLSWTPASAAPSSPAPSSSASPRPSFTASPSPSSSGWSLRLMWASLCRPTSWPSATSWCASCPWPWSCHSGEL